MRCAALWSYNLSLAYAIYFSQALVLVGCVVSRLYPPPSVAALHARKAVESSCMLALGI